MKVIKVNPQIPELLDIMGCSPKLSHEVDLAVVGYRLLCAPFCFASVPFTLLDKLFPYCEQKANETVLNTTLI